MSRHLEHVSISFATNARGFFYLPTLRLDSERLQILVQPSEVPVSYPSAQVKQLLEISGIDKVLFILGTDRLGLRVKGRQTRLHNVGTAFTVVWVLFHPASINFV
jgi:hypothetical protein